MPDRLPNEQLRGAVPDDTVKSLGNYNPSAEFWLVAWLGTAAAGALFGFVVDALTGFSGLGVIGVIVGGSAAGAAAIPLHASAAAVTWALWLTRFRCAVATMSGAMAGAMGASASLELSRSYDADWKPILGAAILAGICTATATHQYQTRTGTGRWLRAHAHAQPWRFSLSAMLGHMAALGVLFAFWTWVINSFVR